MFIVANDIFKINKLENIWVSHFLLFC